MQEFTDYLKKCLSEKGEENEKLAKQGQADFKEFKIAWMEYPKVCQQLEKEKAA